MSTVSPPAPTPPLEPLNLIGFQNSVIAVELGFWAARSYSFVCPPSADRPNDPVVVEIRCGKIGASLYLLY